MRRSSIYPTTITHHGEVEGRWITRARAHCERPAGTLICDSASVGDEFADTFTAADGRRYLDEGRFIAAYPARLS